MTLDGTVVNGVIVLDGSPALPEGARVRVELTAEDDVDRWEDIPPPPDTETREEFLESLRQSIAEAKAGVGGVEARKFLKDLAVRMESRADYMESLRQSIAEVKAGVPGLTVQQTFAMVDAELKRHVAEGGAVILWLAEVRQNSRLLLVGWVESSRSTTPRLWWASKTRPTL